MAVDHRTSQTQADFWNPTRLGNGSVDQPERGSSPVAPRCRAATDGATRGAPKGPEEPARYSSSGTSSVVEGLVGHGLEVHGDLPPLLADGLAGSLGTMLVGMRRLLTSIGYAR
jgi:hypothetical protein